VAVGDCELTWSEKKIKELRSQYPLTHRVHCPYQRSYDLVYMCHTCGLGVLRDLRNECPYWKLRIAMLKALGEIE